MRLQQGLPGLLCVLFLAGSAHARPASDALSTAWNAVAGESADAEPIRAAIRSLAADASRQGLGPDDIAEASHQVALSALLARGADETESIALAAAIETEMRGALAPLSASWASRTVPIGPLELTPGRIRAMLGPREGRDRNDIVTSLDAAAHAQGVKLTKEESLDLVPVMVAVADATILPATYLEPLRDVVLRGEAQQ